MDKITYNEQVRMKSILDEHFTPMLREEWKSSISVYEIGCRPKDGMLSEIIVWLRSFDIASHLKGLMVPSDPMMVLDPTNRTTSTVPGIADSLRHEGETIMVRLLKQVDSKTEGKVDLLVELFQVFGDEGEAEDAFEKVKSVTAVN